MHIHQLRDLADLAIAERPDGAIKALYEARDQKVVKAIGITCHANPAALMTALERHDFDATQMALNAGLARMAEGGPAGMTATPMPTGSFESLALPVAVRKKLGIIAMKVFGQDQLVGTAPIEKLLRYALSLPVSLTSLGMPRLECIEQNAALATAVHADVRGRAPRAVRRNLRTRRSRSAPSSAGTRTPSRAAAGTRAGVGGGWLRYRPPGPRILENRGHGPA